MNNTSLKRTPFYEQHVQCKAKLVDFAGWEMPLLYRGINEEHRYTREKCSLFDVSHMGRLEISGDGAEAFLEYVCTRRLGDMAVGQARYSHVCNENGGILDDVIVSRYESQWMIVCNGANRDKIVAWLHKHAAGRPMMINDITEATAMLAVQGPLTFPQAMKKIPIPLGDLKRYRFLAGNFMGMPYSIYRTGYTGEDGVEVILPAGAAAMAWSFLMQSDDEFEPPVVQPAGLGSRDTLRLEAGMPLYGHELHENIDSLQADLAWGVDLNKDFIGAEAMRRLQKAGLPRKLIGLELDGKRIARQGSPVTLSGKTIGEVTSGTFGPTVQKSIAMAYLDTEHAVAGRNVRVTIRDHEADAIVRALPFYKRNKASQ